MAACLPEQLWASAVGTPRIETSVTRSSGSAGGQRSALSSRPPSARIRAASIWWSSLPMCDAQAIATEAASRSSARAVEQRQRGRRLERLERRAREDRQRRITERGQHRPVRARHHGVPPVPGLHHAVARHFHQHLGAHCTGSLGVGFGRGCYRVAGRCYGMFGLSGSVS